MKGRILVVDDDPAILEVVRLNLEAEGYEVVTATDAGTRACARSMPQPCVLAILDVMLPDADGFELARRLRERSDIPIVMLSARDSDVDKAVGLGVGADDYVTKPFSPIELVARVKAHLRRYGCANAARLRRRRDHRGRDGPYRRLATREWRSAAPRSSSPRRSSRSCEC